MDTFELENNRDAVILDQIEKHPDATQATLAQRVGVAVGTINWHLKRLVAKGYVKVRRAERRKLSYIITPEGLALRARLTLDYVQNQFRLYRHMRMRTSQAIAEIKQAGFHTIRLEAEGDAADVCRLTCMELGIEIVDHLTPNQVPLNLPLLKIDGLKIIIDWKNSLLSLTSLHETEEKG
jgi:DNA-binding MarR family transcriptional regulator